LHLISWFKGGTIKLFVRLLDIKKDSQSVQYLINEINETVSGTNSTIERHFITSVWSISFFVN
jgi:hypothetical protein